MLFGCLPSDARIPGRFPGPPHPRGAHFTIDIHCHVLTESAEAMFRAAGQVERWPRDVFANPHTREVNRQHSARTRVQSPLLPNSSGCTACSGAPTQHPSQAWDGHVICRVRAGSQ
jgi:hypothetical protein